MTNLMQIGAGCLDAVSLSAHKYQVSLLPGGLGSNQEMQR